jgi:SAM-dependent methyltransferase
VGWISTFTNKAIPEIEMREWLEFTVERIAALGSRKILEIGCGVGLLVGRLAPGSVAYRGTDLSPVAISRLRQFVASKPELQHVELLEHEAADFDGVAQDSVDTVVLNSVVQYFPSIDYLYEVLEKAARTVTPGGHIFVGDVRHLGLLPIFHGAVQLAKAPPEASAGWLKRKITLAVEQERELVIGPEFFLGLSKSIPRITGVEVLIKRGSDNELTRYRYDAVLHIEGPQRFDAGQLPEWRVGKASAEELLARFCAQNLPAVRLLNVANSRLAADLAAVRSLRNADGEELIGDIREKVENPGTAIDPEAIWQSANKSDCEVHIGYSPHSEEGVFDVTLIDRRQGAGRTSFQHSASAVTLRKPVATDPLAAIFMQQLGLELGNVLMAELPELSTIPPVIALNKAAFDEMVGAPSLAPSDTPDDVSWSDHKQLIDR